MKSKVLRVFDKVVDGARKNDTSKEHIRTSKSSLGTRDDQGFENSCNETSDSEEVTAAEASRDCDGAQKTVQAPQTVTSEECGTMKPKPKIRIKLKLPAQAKRKLPISVPSVVTKSDGLAVEEECSSRPAKSFKKSLPLSKHVTGTGSRRRPVAPSKQVKIPPIPSPGLLLPGKPTPSEIFDIAMEAAGYTVKQRNENPHRGSSVQKTVDDMFDTDVKLSLHQIELVPRDLLEGVVERNGESVKLVDLLSKQLEKADRVAKTPPSFLDMVPFSLTLPYPKTYLDSRLEYVRNVREREKKIVQYQEESQDVDVSTEEGAEKMPNLIVVPAIPELPEPFTVEHLGLKKTDFSSKSQHPIYLPARADLVAHLDPKCFHITHGRYFGLMSNKTADPNACGPNAAGFSGTSGLATATTSTTTSTSGLSGGGMTLILSAGFHCAAAVPLKETAAAKPLALLSPPAAPSETANSLRLLMMDDAWADKFRVVILKAAIYASRTQLYDTSFKGPNNLVYPDLGKAFSMYAQVKPCSRCKNNKQGVYHCRIRRRHKEVDFDGGSTPSVLEPYEVIPLESLLVT